MTTPLRTGLAIALAFALTACSHPRAAAEEQTPAATPGIIVIPPDSPRLSLIRVAQVQTVEAPAEEVTAPARLELNPNRISHVMLPVAGRIAAVKVQLGDSVRQGDVLIELQSSDADAAAAGVSQAEAALSQAKSIRGKAQSDFDRLKDLYEHEAVARKDMLAAQSDLAKAAAAEAQAQAARDQAGQRASFMGVKRDGAGDPIPVRATTSGKILEMSVAVNENRNNTSESLITIADARTLWITSDVPESDIRFCRAGAAIEAELAAFPGQTFHARVDRIADTLDPQTRTLKVHAELDNASGRFLPEMSGKIRCLDAARRVVVFEEGALLHAGGRALVYVQEAPGRFAERDVTVGRRVGDKLAALSGLRDGERVVVEGAIYLRNGL